MEFVVDRKTWFRGKGGTHSYLLNDAGLRCCIGFVCQQCDIPDDEIIATHCIASLAHNISVDVEEVYPKLPVWIALDGVRHIATGDGNSIRDAYYTNDDEELTDADREAKLKAIFEHHGDSIRFEG